MKQFFVIIASVSALNFIALVLSLPNRENPLAIEDHRDQGLPPMTFPYYFRPPICPRDNLSIPPPTPQLPPPPPPGPYRPFVPVRSFKPVQNLVLMRYPALLPKQPKLKKKPTMPPPTQPPSPPPPAPCPGCPICAPVYQPICASDGQTYRNACLFNCARLCDPDLDVEAYIECGLNPLEKPQLFKGTKIIVRFPKKKKNKLFK